MSIYQTDAAPTVGTSDKDKLKFYQSCIQGALDWRSGEGYDELWKRMIEMYAGNHYASKKVDDKCDQIMINMMWSTVNVVTAATTVRNPEMTVNPRNVQSILPAKMVEAVLNHDWEVYAWQKEVRASVKDSQIIGHGIVKVGYTWNKVKGQRNSENQWDLEKLRSDIDAASIVGMHSGYRLKSSTTNTDTKDDAYIARLNERYTSQLDKSGYVTVDDHPLITRVSPFDFIIDPTVTRFQDARWLAHRSLMPVRVAKAKYKWDAQARNNLNGSTTMEELPLTRGGKFQHEELVWIYEFYDIITGEMATFAKGADRFLWSPHPIPFPFGQPFRFIENEEVPDVLYPVGELEQIETLQRELNDARNEQTANRRRYKRKVLVEKSLIEREGNKAALQSNKENDVIVWDRGEDGNRPIEQVPLPEPPSGVFADIAAVQNDIYTVSGISGYQRGVTGVADTTATEAAIINDASQARAALKISNIEDFMRDIAEAVVGLYQVYLESDRVVRITGGAYTDTARQAGVDPTQVTKIEGAGSGVFAGGDLFMVVSRNEIAGQFDFKVEAGSSRPINASEKRQRAQQLMALLAPFAGPAGSGAPINIETLIRRVLSEGFQMVDVEDLFNSIGQSLPPELAGLQPGSAPGGVTPLGGQVGPPQNNSAPVPTIQ